MAESESDSESDSDSSYEYESDSMLDETSDTDSQMTDMTGYDQRNMATSSDEDSSDGKPKAINITQPHRSQSPIQNQIQPLD